MRWWRAIRPQGGAAARDVPQAGAQAAAMARLRGQCHVAAGECVPWDDEGDDKCDAPETGEERARDERR